MIPLPVRSTVTGKKCTATTSTARITGAAGSTLQRAGDQEPQTDAEERAEEHEVREVRQVHDVGAEPPDQREFQEQHQCAARDQPPDHAAVGGVVGALRLVDRHQVAGRSPVLSGHWAQR